MRLLRFGLRSRLRGRLAMPLVGAFALVLLLPGASPAQRDGPTWSTSTCLDSVRPPSRQRVAAYLDVDAVPATPREVLDGMRVLASDIADATDSLLGAVPGALPEAEPRLSWRDVEFGQIVVTAHRDGTLSWHLSSGDRSRASRMLGRALDRVIASGTSFSWPHDAPGDSASGFVHLVAPFFSRRGTLNPAPVHRGAVPILSVAMPEAEKVRPRSRWPELRYPPAAEEAGVEGTVVLTFVVDTAGRADSATIQDGWPPGRAPLVGSLGGYYDEMRAAATRAILAMRFSPERIGGCPLAERVVESFRFRGAY